MHAQLEIIVTFDTCNLNSLCFAGSAQTVLGPYWASVLGKTSFLGKLSIGVIIELIIILPTELY